MAKQPKVRKPHPVLHGIGLALSAILLVAVLAGTYLLSTMATIIDSFIGAPSGHYSKTEIADTKLKAEALAAEVEAEGTVLVQNNDNTLPLNADTKKVNVFGWASTAWLGGGSGSGGVNAVNTDLLAALTAYGIEYNTELTDMYKDFQSGREYIRTLNSRPEQSGRLYEPDINNTAYYTQTMLDNAKNYSDTAVVVIGRLAGESNDATKQQYKRTEKGGDIVVDDTRTMLELTTEEENLLTYVGANYKNVVVLVNSTNVMELGQLETIPGVDACLIAGLSGSEAASVIPAVLWGEKEPSGRTADTWAYDLTTAASYANAGLEGVGAYTDAEGLYPADGTTCGNLDAPYAYEQVSYVDYAEGIYIGYKWYETADAEGYWDAESNEHGTGYDAVVQYPFGYGLSYTTFTQKIDSMTEADGTITLDVTVTNTGSVAGKDVVQVYFNPPYTDGGIEKASANLVTFGKTDSIEPGASQTLTLTFNTEDMASFDSKDKGCYVLEEGDYIISINEDSHTVLDSKTYNVASTIVYDESNPRSTDAEAATTKFDFADDKLVTLSRAGHFANYAEAVAVPSDFTMSEESMNTLYNDHNWTPEDHNDPNDEMPVTGANNGLKLADLRGADYDDERWDTLLDQMTVTEMDDLIALGGYQTKAEASVDKYATIDCDGPAAINNNFTGVSSIGFPSEIIIASTFNTDLARRYGESIGRMASEMNVTGWYAPAMNGHRSAFDGRNFEYYSEDSVLAGYIGASSIAGAQSYGVYAYMKHFALNDQQINQNEMLCTWADEQAIREIYLRPFEISAKVGGCKAVMSSWNYIGNQWAGACNALLNGVLRGEWGFRGMVITDGFHFTDYMDSDIAIRNGCDLMLKNYDVATNHLTDTTSATSVKAMRQACKNIMYTVVNSRVYDPANTVSTPIWRTAMIVVNVLLAVLLVVLEVLTFKSYKKKKAQ